MAEKLKSFDFKRSRGSGSGRDLLYPWSQWTDGSIWQLKQGRDFKPHPRIFAVYLYSRAKKHGKKVTVQVEGDTLTLQFYDKE
jgi:hypothetical protein